MCDGSTCTSGLYPAPGFTSLPLLILQASLLILSSICRLHCDVKSYMGTSCSPTSLAQGPPLFSTSRRLRNRPPRPRTPSSWGRGKGRSSLGWLLSAGFYSSQLFSWTVKPTLPPRVKNRESTDATSVAYRRWILRCAEVMSLPPSSCRRCSPEQAGAGALHYNVVAPFEEPQPALVSSRSSCSMTLPMPDRCALGKPLCMGCVFRTGQTEARSGC